MDSGYPDVLAIGTMSGTSMDGVDVAAITTDGASVSAFGPTHASPYSAGDRAILRAALKEAASASNEERAPDFAEASRIVTERHAEAIEAFCREHRIAARDVGVVGFHGQTVIHRPERALTVQIGDAHALASRLGIPVVYDLRQADMRAGGQGAPLVPVFHRALAARCALKAPVAFLNLGGVANVTYIGRDGSLIAFDTGPANALLDDWAMQHTGQAADFDGRLSGSGQVDRKRLAELMEDPYFDEPAPKSLDRDHFAGTASSIISGLAAQEGAATLAGFTVESVAAALRHFPEPPQAWVVSGGGVNNPVILQGLADRLQVPVSRAEDYGLSSEFMEAQAFGYLAVRALRGLPLSYPGTTGVKVAMPGGAVALPGTAA
ncbi:anhydro-N-acetylmuramic acid kinase [Tepidamorphus sp. 3E244]|uniref:anhydro-N-acetylmuramic acid kinase n=1 Tax=Tepidamorphus sp. 3E244 TaxID=3385498 RepID=UPI0038FC5E5C